MGYRNLKLFGFRNLGEQSLDISAPRLFFIGRNGQGKSNLLESVYLLSYGSSFRTKSNREMINYQRKEATVYGTYTASDGSATEGDVAIRVAPGEKELQLNGKKVRDRKTLISNLPAIVFTHDDISFVSGSPDRQRWFFDQTLSLYDPSFIDHLRTYRKLLKMRNATLKEERKELLDVYDTQLATAGIEIQHSRQRAVEEFNPLFSHLFAEISGITDSVHIEYQPSWREALSGEEAAQQLQERRDRDLLYGTTMSGPHRDRFVFRRGERDFAAVASTGQLRLISLILRIGQSTYYSRKTGRLPVLLLDDVLLELDGEKREALLAMLPHHEQAYFTFLPEEAYQRFVTGETRTYWVEDGWVKTI
jgi:DNA replication and repair protein RecF